MLGGFECTNLYQNQLGIKSRHVFNERERGAQDLQLFNAKLIKLIEYKQISANFTNLILLMI